MVELWKIDESERLPQRAEVNPRREDSMRNRKLRKLYGGDEVS